jgi:hypothetical protein
VKVKWYLNQESVLDMTGSLTLDYYLVMTGPPPRPDEKRLRPWVIDSVYLFDAHHLLDELIKGGVKVGLAASVRKDQWQKAKIYPQSSISAYPSLLIEVPLDIHDLARERTRPELAFLRGHRCIPLEFEVEDLRGNPLSGVSRCHRSIDDRRDALVDLVASI